MISEPTKDAVRKAEFPDVVLGNPNVGRGGGGSRHDLEVNLQQMLKKPFVRGGA
jgi:hypothetical protein